MYLKKVYPFEFKAIEYYNIIETNGLNNALTVIPHWKEIEYYYGRKIIFKYYGQRFHDGLIERTEIIGQKTVEKYQNRDDKLIYLSVKFSPVDAENASKDFYCYHDRHVNDVKI